MQLEDEILKLRAELDRMRAEQSSDRRYLEERLTRFSNKLDSLSLSAQQQTSVASTVINASHGTETADEQIEQIEQIEQQQFIHASKSSTTEQVGNQLGNSVSQFSTSLGELTSSLLGPFSAIASQVKSFYQHYQSKGLGPVFLMTLAGIIALTLGFGYLLQYSINNWLSEFAKVLLGFVSANALLAGGIFIRKKQPKMADFGSSLVGLGLILNYLCAYFIGPYFELIPTGLSFLLLLLITLAGFGVSMQVNAKVVSIIALVGGSLAPMMLLSDSHLPLLYLPYLLLIGTCSLLQSRKLAWPVLMEVTAFLHIACIETFILYLDEPLAQLDWQAIIALASVNGIFYVYGLTGFRWSIKAEACTGKSGDDTVETLSKRILAMPFALLAFILITLNQLTHYSGELFLANGVICASLFMAFRGSKQTRALQLVFAGSFFGFAALELISPDFLGLVLLLEGLLLLWLGCKEAFISVRAEAYVLLAIGTLLNISGITIDISSGINTGLEQTHVSLSDFTSFGFPLLTLLLNTAALFTAITLMTQTPTLNDIEDKILIICKELLSVKYCASILFISYLVSDKYFLNVLPFISVLMLHLAAKDKLKFTEALAWLLLLPLAGLVTIGILEVGSISFSRQPVYAQLARGELFLSLWLAYYWYQRHYTESAIIKAAYWLQIGCYLAIPLLFLPKVMRSFEDYLSIGLWLSCFISLGLARFVRHKALTLEAQLLTVAAIMVTAISCLAEHWQGLIALTVGAGFMLYLLKNFRQLSPQWQAQLTLQWHISPFYFALVIAVMVQTLMGILHLNVGQTSWSTVSWSVVSWGLASWSIVTVTLAGYFALLISRKPVPDALRPGYTVAYTLVYACALLPLLMHSVLALSVNTFAVNFFEVNFFEVNSLGINSNVLLLNLAETASLIILAKLILTNGLAIRFHQRSISLKVLHWSWHILLGLSYLLWSYQLSIAVAAPLSAILMVAHGSWLMFISLRPQQEKTIKLAAVFFALAAIKVIFIDMAAFELIQKVVAFMVIGAILLSVSYFYQNARYQQLALSEPQSQ
jgi:hypothetical protein